MEFAHSVLRAASSGNPDSLFSLLSADAAMINSPDFDGNMPLHLACSSGSSECVRICLSVLKEQSNLNFITELRRENFQGKDCLTCAIEGGNIDSITCLIQAGAQLDYRFRQDAPPLLAALSQENFQITSLILDNVDVNFDQCRHEKYWLLALHDDLLISLSYFRLLKAHAFPYTLEDFEEICSSVLKLPPSTKGVEDVVIYLCTDAVERWSIHRDQIQLILARISVYFLSKLVPVYQNLSCIYNLQKFGLYKSPHNALLWLGILSKWGLPEIKIHSASTQHQLLCSLAGLSENQTVISDRNLIPLVLFLAIIALKFPCTNWLSDWYNYCKQAGFGSSDCKLFVLLNKYKLSSENRKLSCFKIFWRKIFTFTLSRAILYVKSSLLSFDDCKGIFDHFLQFIYSDDSSLFSYQNNGGNLMFFKILCYFSSSTTTPYHELFLYTLDKYFLPWIDDNDLDCTPHLDIYKSSTIHILTNYSLFELVINFSSKLALKLLTITSDWSYLIELGKFSFLRLIKLCYIESNSTLKAPSDLNVLLGSSLGLLQNQLSTHILYKWFNEWHTEPQTLCNLSKSRIRIYLRRSAYHNSKPKQPLNKLIHKLPVPKFYQNYLNDLLQ